MCILFKISCVVAKVHRLPCSCFRRYLCTVFFESHPIPSSSKENKLSVGPVKSKIKNKVPRKVIDGDTMVIKLAKKVMWNQITSRFHAFLSFKKKYSGCWFTLIGSSFWQAKERSASFSLPLCPCFPS